MAVNLSAKQFNGNCLLETIRRTLDETGLDPEYLELELTESILMENAGATRHTLRRITSYNVCYTKLLRAPLVLGKHAAAAADELISYGANFYGKRPSI